MTAHDSPSTPPARRSDEDRAALLDAAIEQEMASGGRLETLTPHLAVVEYGCGNILLHITFAVLTLFTCGLFVFPWIVWANTNRQHRVTLEVDPYGAIIRSG
jgi:hypothetical protein